jgi:hypothetical protein
MILPILFMKCTFCWMILCFQMYILTDTSNLNPLQIGISIFIVIMSFFMSGVFIFNYLEGPEMESFDK